MSRTIIITSAVPLTKSEIDSVVSILNISSSDSVSYKVDPQVIAGLRASIDGQTIDFTVNRQLERINE